MVISDKRWELCEEAIGILKSFETKEFSTEASFQDELYEVEQLINKIEKY